MLGQMWARRALKSSLANKQKLSYIYLKIAPKGDDFKIRFGFI